MYSFIFIRFNFKKNECIFEIENYLMIDNLKNYLFLFFKEYILKNYLCFFKNLNF